MKKTLMLLTLMMLISKAYSQIATYNLAESRYGIAIVKFNDEVHFIGGSNKNTIDIINTTTNEINTTNYIDTDEFESCDVLQNENYAIFYNLTNVNTSFINYMRYNHIENTWIAEKNNEFIWGIDHSFIDGNNVYFFSDNDKDSIYLYNLENNVWTKEESPFEQREFALVQDSNYVYCVGGTINGTTTKNIAVYDLHNNTWSHKQISTERRRESEVAIWNNKVVINGGFNAFLDEVEIFDPMNETSQIFTLESSRNKAKIISNNDKILIYGGGSSNIDIIDGTSLEVTRRQLEDVSYFPNIDSETLNDYIIFAGTRTDSIYVYHTLLNKWKTIEFSSPRYEISMKSFDNRLYIAGGKHENGELIDELVVVNSIIDVDMDGFDIFDDCDDTNPNINPDAEEILDNGIDEDCDGMDMTTGVHELGESTLRIYPNPVSDHLNIEVNSQLNFKLSLFDLSGKQVFSSTNQKFVNLNPIPRGTYSLEVEDIKTGKKIVDKIVIGK